MFIFVPAPGREIRYFLLFVIFIKARKAATAGNQVLAVFRNGAVAEQAIHGVICFFHIVQALVEVNLRQLGWLGLERTTGLIKAKQHVAVPRWKASALVLAGSVVRTQNGIELATVAFGRKSEMVLDGGNLLGRTSPDAVVAWSIDDGRTSIRISTWSV
jgi:hypothetical protein